MAVVSGRLLWSALMVGLSALLPTPLHVFAYSGHTVTPSFEQDNGCQEGLPPPEHPFRVVWNHPDNCEHGHSPLPLQQYGFVFNRQRQFLGEEIQTLYRTGRWPLISQSGQHLNGGLPQLFNDTSFTKTWADFRVHTVANFTGLGVLDWESWRAIYVTNFGGMRKYKVASMDLVRRRHPGYNKTMVSKTAEREWEEGARKMMLGKLSVGQSLMPGGHWGYYNYPRAWDGNSTPGQNNKIAWLWRQATGLYPSIYLTNPKQATAAKMQRVSKAVGEAVRIQNTFSPPNTVIYPYCNIQQGTNIFFDADHLKVIMGLPADMGASGVVVWGSSSLNRDRQQCARLQQHMHTVLGPFVRNLTDFMGNCSQQLCGGHGRCVHNSHDVLITEAQATKLSTLCTPRDSRFRDYHCRCYSHWTGACCHTPKRSPCQHQETTTATQTPHDLKTTKSPGSIPNATTPRNLTDEALIGR